jgi:carbamate kinase
LVSYDGYSDLPRQRLPIAIISHGQQGIDMRILVALGGNAMTSPEGSARPEDQRVAITTAMESIAEMIGAGHQVILTHGNGPQVGNILVKNELAASVVPPVPLDWCGAQTQGTIGFTMLNALDAALSSRGIDRKCAAIVTRTEVSAQDEGFTHPTKPIGRYLPKEEAQLLISHGQQWEDRGSKGWRRVVASPDPLSILEVASIEALIDAQFVVIASGGGGIPVIREGKSFRGVEAVIDKDLSAAVLASQLKCDLLVIATDVSHAMLGWGTENQRQIGESSALEMRALMSEFAGGSMGPKVLGACRFAENGGISIITSLQNIERCVEGIDSDVAKYGTVVRGTPKMKEQV